MGQFYDLNYKKFSILLLLTRIKYSQTLNVLKRNPMLCGPTGLSNPTIITFKYHLPPIEQRFSTQRG